MSGSRSAGATTPPPVAAPRPAAPVRIGIDVRAHRATWVLLALLAATIVAALSAGRYALPPSTLYQVLLADLGWTGADVPEAALRIVNQVRLPRIALAAIIGAGLAVCGAAMQSVFRNPLAEPQLLGVSSGAAFGGVLGMMLSAQPVAVVLGAFGFGMGSLAAVFWLAGERGGAAMSIVLVLAGLAVSAVFAAGVSLVKLVADPQNQLPAMVFWLMGSLAGADASKLWIAAPTIVPSLYVIHRLRFQLLALSLGDEDARSLGVAVGRTRAIALVAVGLITAAAVAVCGIVGWVGLVVPHLVRLAVGADHRRFVVNVMLAGAIYLVIVDTIARAATQVEIPLGVMTALLGAPMFAYLLRRLRGATGG